VTGDVIAFYAELGITLRPGGRESRARCFANPDAHQRGDRTPSTSVSLISGAWFCHGCGAKGGAYDAARVGGYSPPDAMGLLARHGLAEPGRLSATVRPTSGRLGVNRSTSRPFAVTERDVARWADALQSNSATLALLEEQRGITATTLIRLLAGWDGGRLTIPIRDERDELRGLVRHRPWPGPGPKTLAAPGSQRLLFPHPSQVPGSSIILCEGEIDALTATSVGLPAVAVPGANTWRPRWALAFAGRVVVVVPDADATGRASAALACADLAAAGASAVIFDPDTARDDGYDLGAMLLDQAGASGRLMGVLRRR